MISCGEKKYRNTTMEACSRCTAICCKNLALEIGRPENKKELEDLKWQLYFDTVKVYIRHHRWHQLIKGKCLYLSRKNRCTIYEKRHIICRRHNPPKCEFYGKFYDVMLSTPEELEKYYYGKKRKKSRKSQASGTN